jgi:hypothetical protein
MMQMKKTIRLWKKNPTRKFTTFYIYALNEYVQHLIHRLHIFEKYGPSPDRELSSALKSSNRTSSGINENHTFSSLPFNRSVSKEDLNELAHPASHG